MPKPDQSEMLTPKEVAEREKVHVRTVQLMCKEGKIPARKFGRQWRIYPDYEKALHNKPDSGPKATGE